MQIDSIVLAWLSSFAVIEVVFHAVFRQIGRGTVDEYYNKVPLYISVLGDLSYSTPLFLLSIYIFQRWKGRYPTLSDFMIYIPILIVIQALTDLCWASLVYFLSSFPIMAKNKYINFFKRYATEVGFRAVLADSVYMFIWALTYFLFIRYLDAIWQYFILFLGIFIFVIFSY